MSQGTRLSAFAKRRKIEHDAVSSTTPTPEAEGVNSGLLSNAAEDPDDVVEAQNLRVKSRSRRRKPQLSATNHIDAQNPYAALAHDKAVQLKGTREIEQLSPSSIKVRLSHGSHCTFVGRAKLRVRDGSLSVYGATLKASTEVHHLSASEWSSLPLLTAMSEAVEFQLESWTATITPSQRLGRREAVATTAQHSEQTFSVTSQDKSALLPLDIPRFEGLPQMLRGTANGDSDHVQEPPDSTRRFFIAGKRPTITAAATVALANVLLSEQIRSGQNPGVALLDLDHINPLRSVPGTIGLTLVKQFSLEGTNLYEYHSNASMLLQSIWVSATDPTKFDQMKEGALLEMLKDDQLPVKTPVIIRGGAWSVHAATEPNLQLVREIGKSKVIYVDGTQSSQHFQSSKRIAELSGQELDIRPVYSETSLSPIAEHKACMRAWTCSDKLKYVHELSFGEGKVVNFFAIQGGSLRPIDVLEALTGALVAVALVKQKNEKESLVQDRSTRSSPVTTVGAEPVKALLPISAQTIIGAPCLGLGVIQTIDVVTGKLWFVTEIELQDLVGTRQASQQVGFVLEKPGEDGRFSRVNLKV